MSHRREERPGALTEVTDVSRKTLGSSVEDTSQKAQLRSALRTIIGYTAPLAASHREGLEPIEKESPDFVLLDVMMINGPEAGANHVLTKPIKQSEFFAVVRSLLRVNTLCAQLTVANRILEERVREQMAQLERLERLRRFFSPQLAELIVAGNAGDPLASHRREITVVFLDLRGFTAFAETAEPEEVMAALREYHAAIGQLILEYEGTLERFTGDGMMIFFNDPVPVENHEERAVRMAVAMRDRVSQLLLKWQKRGHELAFGVGITEGYATIGTIGFEGRWDYGAVGTVTNLAARLCARAKSGQILISQRLLAAVEDRIEVEAVGALSLNGFVRPVPAFNVIGLKKGTTCKAEDAGPWNDRNSDNSIADGNVRPILNSQVIPAPIRLSPNLSAPVLVERSHGIQDGAGTQTTSEFEFRGSGSNSVGSVSRPTEQCLERKNARSRARVEPSTARH